MIGLLWHIQWQLQPSPFILDQTIYGVAHEPRTETFRRSAIAFSSRPCSGVRVAVVRGFLDGWGIAHHNASLCSYMTRESDSKSKTFREHFPCF